MSDFGLHEGFMWRFDIHKIPKGDWVEKTVTQVAPNGEKTVTKRKFVPVELIFAVQGITTRSRWLIDPKDDNKGRWEMLANGQQPEAWMLFPEYPAGLIAEQARRQEAA